MRFMIKQQGGVNASVFKKPSLKYAAWTFPIFMNCFITMF